MSRDASGAWMTGGGSSELSGSSPSSDYRRQLRAQCLDQHNRLQQHHRGAPRGPPVRSSTFRAGEDVGIRERWSRDQQVGPLAAERSGSPGELRRSNSSLELDRGSGSADAGMMRRDYGSVNSLDKVDCFSTILRNYRQSIEDGLQHAGGTLHEKLSVRHRDRSGSHSGVVPSFSDSSPKSSATTVDSRPPPVYNGFLQPSDELGSLVCPAVSSPKSKSQKSKDRKARSESGGGGGSLFRKLRGVKSDPYSGSEAKAKVQPDSLSSGGSDPKLEDRIRRKAFCHYDCQSIGVNLSEVIRLRTGSGGSETCLLKRTNTSTGASAASAAALRGLSTLSNGHQGTSV